MPAPFFSVIVPCLNAADTIAQTLASIATQTETDHEVILVDGGSSDGTIDIVQTFGGLVSRCVSERDAGVYSAMNKGTRLASGQWLLFLGANDRLAGPQVLRAVRERIDAGTPAMYCGEARYDDGRTWRAPTRPRVARRNFMHHQSSFYHCALFSDSGFDESLGIQADYEFNLRHWMAGTRLVPMSILVATCACGGLSDSGRWQNYREEITVRHRHLPSWRCWTWDTGSVVRFVRKKFVRLLRPISRSGPVATAPD